MTSMGPGSRLRIRFDPEPRTHQDPLRDPMSAARDPAPKTISFGPWGGTSDPAAGSSTAQRLGGSTAIPCGIQTPGGGSGARQHPNGSPRSGTMGAESGGLGRSIAAQRGMRSRAEFLRSIAGATRWERRWSGTRRRWSHGRIRPCPRWPRGSGAARIPAPGAHLLLQLLHLFLVRQLRFFQHPPLRRLLLQELDFPAGRQECGCAALGWVSVPPLLGAGRWGGGCWGLGLEDNLCRGSHRGWFLLRVCLQREGVTREGLVS